MNRRGFTIIELVVVIVVIGILATISIVAYRGLQERAKTVAISTAVDQWQKVIQLDMAYSNGSASISGTSCLGKPGDFPARDGFDEGVCITHNGASVAMYDSSFYANLNVSGQDLPSGDLPITTVSLNGGMFRARGILATRMISGGNTTYRLEWVPQIGGECSRGTPHIGDQGSLEGDICLLVF